MYKSPSQCYVGLLPMNDGFLYDDKAKHFSFFATTQINADKQLFANSSLENIVTPG
ncbi:hypothetical protein KDK_73330 [Dictyobacter kobayashii]|uniref:Uncharacterized protein n=1 Tax=Dictyobacter kobayashii TaxID=2014872 RepID=A0A402AWW5_9CHLR|nr:hypothetical protein KDK_73330 [Dictyobacter kobayashii]